MTDKYSDNYFSVKMRESRLRRKTEDKTFYKNYLYSVEINGQKYLFLNKQSIKINKIPKNETHSAEYIKTF